MRRLSIGFPEWFFIIGLLLIAAALRFAGTNFGQPDPAYMPSDVANRTLPTESPVHPDEFLFVAVPFRMSVTKYPNPKFFEEPSFLIYTNMVFDLLTGSARGITQELRAGVGDRQYAPFSAYVMGRLMTALGGIVVVAGSYALARRLAGRLAAAAAGLLVTLSFTMVQQSHYSTPSMISAAFSGVCLWASVAMLQQRRPNPWLLALAGVAAGFAATARYNVAGVSMVFFFASLILLYRHRSRRTLRMVLVGWFLFPAAFVFGTPGIVFDLPKWIDDFQYITSQFLTTGAGFNANYLTNPWLAILFEYRYLILFSLGVPATAAALLGLWVALRHRPRRLFERNSLFIITVILLIYVAAYTLVVLRNIRPIYNDHMLVPIIPIFALYAGMGVVWLSQRLRRLRVPSVVALPGLMLALVVVTLVPAVQVDRLFTQIDTRYVMQHWVWDHLPQGANIHLTGSYNVPLDPAQFTTTQGYMNNFVSVEALRQSGAQYALVSDAWLHDVQRSREWMSPEFIAKVTDYYASYDREATEIARIDRPQWTGSDWFMHTASYWHDPALTLYCLTPEACAAVR